MSGPVAVGERLDLPALARIDGRPLPAAAWDGQALVMTFFATDCHYCREHDQRLERLSQAMHGRGLVVLGVASDRSAAAVADYARSLGLGFDLVLDPDGALRGRVTTRRIVPFTAVRDARGVLREAIPGALSEEDALGLAHWASRAP